MKHNKFQDPIQIHQLMYGYNDGHCLLAGSISPSGQSERTLLALSDLSGQGCVVDDQSYITGYPLPDMGVYALARTWLATEMPRPGCVWTHTLLIDFSDLAYVEDHGILKLFKRPQKINNRHLYSKPLILMKELSSTKLSNDQLLTPLHNLLKALYDVPRKSLFTQSDDGTFSEELCFALWLQQWPRLRRNFRFCTCSSSDRSRGNEQFDIQFVPNKRIYSGGKFGKYGRWIDIFEPISATNESWLNIAMNDIVFGERDSILRNFLWRYGAEAKEGRAVFRVLVQLWDELENKSRVDLDVVVRAVNELTPSIPGILLRLISEIFKNYQINNSLSPLVIKFMIDNLSVLEGKVSDTQIPLIATIIGKHAPNAIWQFVRSGSSFYRMIAMIAVGKMGASEVLSGADQDADLFCTILKSNPRIARSPLVWEAEEPIPERSAEILSNLGLLDEDILYSMLRADNIIIPQVGIEFFGQDAVNTAIECYENMEIHSDCYARRWIVAAQQYPNHLFTSVSQGLVKYCETLGFISTLVDCRGNDPLSQGDLWIRALNSTQDDIGKADISFSYFLLGRALSGVSPEPLPLIHFSFAVVHKDLRESYSETNRWVMLAEFLPEIPKHRRWDRACRLRWGIVKFFYDQKSSPKYFFNTFSDKSDFEKIVDEATSFLEGRKYLKKVDSWVKENGGNDVYPWNTLVESALRPASKIFGFWDFFSK